MEAFDLKRVYRLINDIENVKIGDFADSPNSIILDGRGKNIPKGTGYVVGTSIAYKLNELAKESGQGSEKKYFLVSGDGRLDTAQITHEIQEALIEQGITVLSAGYENTTPFFDVNREWLGISGVNVTASHQSHEYNGFKLVFDAPNNKKGSISQLIKDATKYHGQEIFDVQSLLFQRYTSGLIEFASGIESDGAVLYDAMHGASYPFFETVARAISLEHIPFREKSNGYFPLTAKGPDPSYYANLSFLRQHANQFGCSMIHIADGDGDRYALSLNIDGEILMIEPAYFVALRAANLKEGRRTKYVAEHSLAAVVNAYLRTHGVGVIAVKRGRASHIGATKRLRYKAIGASEIGLHHYDENGFDDAVKNTFELMKINQRIIENDGNLIQELGKIKQELPFFFPELRVGSAVPKNMLYKEIKDAYPESNEGDGIIYRTNGLFWNLRASSNADEKTLNISGDESKVHRAFEDLTSRLSKIDTGLANAFREDLEKKLQDREKFCF
ncbi:MAG: hypothetical protein U9O94_02020 [Nanoarchaeota archaeon]|nr:hypothetical protein [Nanoarchaeota archaeon]